MASETEQILSRAGNDLRSGKVAQAEWALRKILNREPRNAKAMDLMGAIALLRGQTLQAVQWLMQAVAVSPGDADLQYNLGVMLASAGDVERAIDAYTRAIALRPEMVTAHNNLGNILRGQGRLTEAAEHFRQALRIRPDYVLAHNNLGLILLDLGRIDEGIESLRNALRLKPDYAGAHSNLLLALNSHESYDRAALLAGHREFARRHSDALAPAKPPTPQVAADGRIRVGYVSADFRSHSVAFFLDKILANHDRTRFAVTCYSNVARPDAMTARMRGNVEQWRDISIVSDDAAAEMIRADNIDVLVELGGHTEQNRLLLLAHKPAPIQMTYLGYPSTTGISQIDDLITDSSLAPEGTDSSYAEKVLRLPGSFFCYFGPELGIPISPPPTVASGRITFGVLTNWIKVRPPMMELWAKILAAAPNSRLVFKARSLRDEKLVQEVRSQFAARDLDPSRIETQAWTDFPNYLRQMSEIDIGLDTFPFNGHTTTCHQLWMGVPVITLVGGTHASRMGKSIMSAMDLAELVARSAEEYVACAINLASDVAHLAELRRTMRDRWQRSGLLDGRRFTSELEEIYRSVVQTHVRDRR